MEDDKDIFEFFNRKEMFEPDLELTGTSFTPKQPIRLKIITIRRGRPFVPLVSILGKRGLDILCLDDKERYGQKILDDFFTSNVGHGC
jgi:hypothetical protein